MINWLGPIVYEYYAGSEASGLTAVDTPTWLSHPGTVGRPVFGQVHIVGEDGEELPTGEKSARSISVGAAGSNISRTLKKQHHHITRGAGARWATLVTSMRTDLYICVTGARI